MSADSTAQVLRDFVNLQCLQGFLTALLPIIAGYQLSSPENKSFIFQLWPHILKAFHCVPVLFTVEMVLPYLLDLGCTFGPVMSI